MSLRRINIYPICQNFSFYTFPSLILVELDTHILVNSTNLMGLLTHFPIHWLHCRFFKVKCFQKKFRKNFQDIFPNLLGCVLSYIFSPCPLHSILLNSYLPLAITNYKFLIETKSTVNIQTD